MIDKKILTRFLPLIIKNVHLRSILSLIFYSIYSNIKLIILIVLFNAKLYHVDNLELSKESYMLIQ